MSCLRGGGGDGDGGNTNFVVRVWKRKSSRPVELLTLPAAASRK
jgi:hypothetical protein